MTLFGDMTSLPAWVGPTVAIALVVIALAFLAIALVAVAVARQATSQASHLAREIGDLRRELAPTIQALNRLAGAGGEVAGRLKDEVDALITVSRRLRKSVVQGARRVEGRLEDLDALYEVVSSEVQDTALDVAATLRTVRTGASALSRIKRFLGRGRR